MSMQIHLDRLVSAAKAKTTIEKEQLMTRYAKIGQKSGVDIWSEILYYMRAHRVKWRIAVHTEEYGGFGLDCRGDTPKHALELQEILPEDLIRDLPWTWYPLLNPYYDVMRRR